MPPRHLPACLLLLASLSCAHADSANSPAPRPRVAVEKVTYNGWPDAYRLRNDACELVVVPAVSRVMSFRLSKGSNVLWDNPQLAGKTFPQDPRAWQNIGGDKLWPTQQNLFGKFTGVGYDFPPPWPWDAGPATAEAIDNGVRLTLPTDPRFGAHAVREFTLHPTQPLVFVRQRILKTAGEPAPFTVWTVTQVNDPALAFLPTPDGAFKLLGPKSDRIKPAAGHVALGREPKTGLKIGVAPQKDNGFVAATFATTADRPQLLVISHALRTGPTIPAYPDNNLQAELYSSPTETAKYTELELLSPLVTLKPGESVEDNQIWQLASQPKDAAPLDAAKALHAKALDLLK